MSSDARVQLRIMFLVRGWHGRHVLARQLCLLDASLSGAVVGDASGIVGVITMVIVTAVVSAIISTVVAALRACNDHAVIACSVQKTGYSDLKDSSGDQVKAYLAVSVLSAVVVCFQHIAVSGN